MEDKIVLVDTSILIDLFRKTDKANSVLISLVKQGYTYYFPLLPITRKLIFRYKANKRH